jgi:hypothetical protein
MVPISDFAMDDFAPGGAKRSEWVSLKEMPIKLLARMSHYQIETPLRAGVKAWHSGFGAVPGYGVDESCGFLRGQGA